MEFRDIDKFDPGQVSANEIYKFLVAQWQHQNQLSWGKLYSILAVESALLAASYSATTKLVGCGAIVIGSFVCFILYQLIRRDWDVRNQRRLLELLDAVHNPLGIRMIPPARSKWENGQFLLALLMRTLLATNVVVAGILILR
jgi:hypothetical protein